jgi:nucleoside-diphosphate-sugar epimerase
MALRNTRVALVGGRGFVGDNLSAFLEKQSCIHCVIDMAPSTDDRGFKSRTDYCADICNEEDICAIFREFSPTIVVHLASYGMCGPAMLDPVCFTINYEGTQNIISACRRFNIRGLIYTSTYNVVFGGQEVDGGSDSTPYFSGEHSDQYAPSKTLAEKLVLACNNSQTEDGYSLITCSLRPAAIYGPGESRHFPRIVSVMDRSSIRSCTCIMIWLHFVCSGLYIVKIGNAVVDWVHVDNIVSMCNLIVLVRDLILVGFAGAIGSVFRSIDRADNSSPACTGNMSCCWQGLLYF